MPATRVLLLLHVHVYSFTTRVLLLHLLINYELFYSCNVNSNQPMPRGLSCRIVWMSSSHWRRVSRLGRGRPNSNSPLCRRSLKRWRERIVIMLRNYAKQWNKYVIFTRITHFYCLILIIIILYIYVRELLKHISFIFLHFSVVKMPSHLFVALTFIATTAIAYASIIAVAYFLIQLACTF